MGLSPLHTHTEALPEIKAEETQRELGQEKGSFLTMLSSWIQLCMKLPSPGLLYHEPVAFNSRWLQVSVCHLSSSPAWHTRMPAVRHLSTASGTVARGGSIMETSPAKQRPLLGKFMASTSKA